MTDIIGSKKKRGNVSAADIVKPSSVISNAERSQQRRAADAALSASLPLSVSQSVKESLEPVTVSDPTLKKTPVSNLDQGSRYSSSDEDSEDVRAGASRTTSS